MSEFKRNDVVGLLDKKIKGTIVGMEQLYNGIGYDYLYVIDSEEIKDKDKILFHKNDLVKLTKQEEFLYKLKH